MDVCEYCGKNIVQLITKNWIHVDTKLTVCEYKTKSKRAKRSVG